MLRERALKDRTGLVGTLLIPLVEGVHGFAAGDYRRVIEKIEPLRSRIVESGQPCPTRRVSRHASRGVLPGGRRGTRMAVAGGARGAETRRLLGDPQGTALASAVRLTTRPPHSLSAYGSRVNAAAAVMAKAPGFGPVKSRLHGWLTPDQATDLYRCFLLDRLDALTSLERVELVIAFTPPDGRSLLAALAPPAFRLVIQRGCELRARLTNLMDDLLGAGHSAAMAIDSDSPTLPVSYIRDAAKELEEGSADLVLGPCEDGGYYLIGLRRPCPALFADIPWSTDRVLPLTLDRARQQGLRTHLLPTWFDVDTEQDLRRLHREMMMVAGGSPRRTFCFVSDLFKDVG